MIISHERRSSSANAPVLSLPQGLSPAATITKRGRSTHSPCYPAGFPRRDDLRINPIGNYTPITLRIIAGRNGSGPLVLVRELLVELTLQPLVQRRALLRARPLRRRLFASGFRLVLFLLAAEVTLKANEVEQR